MFEPARNQAYSQLQRCVSIAISRKSNRSAKFFPCYPVCYGAHSLASFQLGNEENVQLQTAK